MEDRFQFVVERARQVSKVSLKDILPSEYARNLVVQEIDVMGLLPRYTRNETILLSPASVRNEVELVLWEVNENGLEVSREDQEHLQQAVSILERLHDMDNWYVDVVD